MILAAIVIARNPAQYGFDFEPEAPHAYETVTLPRPVDLRRIAEWTDTTHRRDPGAQPRTSALDHPGSTTMRIR